MRVGTCGPTTASSCPMRSDKRSRRGRCRPTSAGSSPRSGCPRTRFHDLRQAHATQLLAAGEHPKAVSERLGHYQSRSRRLALLARGRFSDRGRCGSADTREGRAGSPGHSVPGVLPGRPRGPRISSPTSSPALRGCERRSEGTSWSPAVSSPRCHRAPTRRRTYRPCHMVDGGVPVGRRLRRPGAWRDFRWARARHLLKKPGTDLAPSGDRPTIRRSPRRRDELREEIRVSSPTRRLTDHLHQTFDTVLEDTPVLLLSMVAPDHLLLLLGVAPLV
jgi:hypothetical protein